MFSVTDIVNKTNAKRLGWWFLHNKRSTVILVFMIVSLCYKWFHKNPIVKYKLKGQQVALFSDLKKSGSLEMNIRGEKVLVNLANYMLPELSDNFDKDRNSQCEAQVHVYLQYVLKNMLYSAIDLKVDFADNHKESVEINSVNIGFAGKVLFDGKDLSQELTGKHLLCDLVEIRKHDLSECDWCKIRDKSGLPINN